MSTAVNNDGSIDYDFYSICLDVEGENATDRIIMQCMSREMINTIKEQQIQHIQSLRNVTSSFKSYSDNDGPSLSPSGMNQYPLNQYHHTSLLIFAAALVFSMQAGFAMVCAGAVRKKNVQNSMLKNLLDACGAAIAFYAFGYAFAFGNNDSTSTQKTFIGTSNFFLMNDFTNYSFWLFQYAFSAAATTIVAGTLAERCQMAAYLCYSCVLSGWVYPVVVHAIWSTNGFLSASSVNPLWGVGMVDFAGSAVVHITGGTTGLFATIILGARRGRFHDDTGLPLETPREFRGHSSALQMLGTFLLWFGWYGFNAGSALSLRIPSEDSETLAALAAVNTTISAGAACIASIITNFIYLDRTTGEPCFDIKFAMNGALAGLVAVTGSCGVVEPWAALIIGTLAGILYFLGSYGLVKLRLDDAVDAIPVHLVCGIWGVISAGLFASPKYLQMAYGRSNHAGLVYGTGGLLLGVQCIGILFVFGWVMTIMLPFFVWLDWKGWFRSDPLEEIVGLDLSYHGGLPLVSHNDYDDSVAPEYLSEYRKKKEEKRSLKNKRIDINTHEDDAAGEDSIGEDEYDNNDNNNNGNYHNNHNNNDNDDNQ